MTKPDYQQGSIVNLMASILRGLGNHSNFHNPLPELDQAIFNRVRNVVLVVIDGLGYHYLTQQAPHSTLHQYLKRKLTSVFPSTTATAITTFMTGMAPQQHGLSGWFTYFEEINNILTVLPAVPRIKGNLQGQAELDIAKLYNHAPLFDLLDVDSYIVSPRYIAHSEFSLAHCGKATIVPYDNLEHCFAVTRDTIKASSDKKYIYTYWPQFDGLAHEHGVGSNTVMQHLRDIDNAFTRFLQDIDGSNTLVIVTADHGMIDSGPDYCIELQHHPQLQQLLRMPLSGERRMAYCYVAPQNRDAFLRYLKNHLSEQVNVYPSRQLLEQQYYGLGPAHAELHHRIGDYVLEMNRNFTIMDNVAGERTFYHIGTHGGLSEEEMWVPLILADV